VIHGVLGDVLPLYPVITVGNLLSLAPMLYLCFSRTQNKPFVAVQSKYASEYKKQIPIRVSAFLHVWQ